MLRTVLCLLAMLPTLLPPGICVCRFVPCTSASTAKGTEAPRRHRCTCCRHVERPIADSSNRQKTPAHGWSLPTTPHDASCPVVRDAPFPQIVNVGTSQLVMAVGLLAIDGVHLRTISLEPPSEPPHSTRIPAHLGFSVLRI